MGGGGERKPMFNSKLSAAQLLTEQNVKQQKEITELKKEIRRLRRESRIDAYERCDSLY